MKKRMIMLAGVMAVSTLAGCSKAPEKPAGRVSGNETTAEYTTAEQTSVEPTTAEPGTQEEETTMSRTEYPVVEEPEVKAKSNFDAVAKIMDKLATEKEGENLLFSPMSFDIAMAMCANGANDDVKKEFEEYSGVSMEEYNEFIRYYIAGAGEIMDIANSIWIRDSYNILDNYKANMEKYYFAECESRVFDERFVEEVNSWCAEKTRGMIDKIIDKVPAPETAAKLINALYFNGDWETQFEETAVRDTEFTLFDGSQVTFDGMYSSEDIYLENDVATGFMKCYKNTRYAFVGILPKEQGEFNLEELDIEGLLESETKTDVVICMPKIEYDTTMDLKQMLEVAGLDGAADYDAFNGIVNDYLTITDIIQKTVIKINETGTEAAAVTAVNMEFECVMVPSVPKEVYLDRPYAFLIYDRENDVILFAGKVANPVK